MENSLSSIKGQALLEFFMVIIILIPLCVVGLKYLGQSGEKRLTTERNGISVPAEAGIQKIVPQENILTEINELEESSLHLTPTGFELNGKKVDFIEDNTETHEVFSALRSDLREQGWTEAEENGIFIFFREGQRKYAWKMDGGVALMGD